MPPRTRGIKTLKEYNNVSVKNKAKNNVKINRKSLADKTNSASDDNVSILSCNKILKEANKSPEQTKEKSRRTRRLPARYEENNILKNLSNFNSLSPQKVNLLKPEVIPIKTPVATSIKTTKVTPIKTNPAKLTHRKTPLRISNSPLVKKRPKRICRLPSKFDGQSLSPIKNSAIQPSHASTPISNKLRKPFICDEFKNKPQKKVQNSEEANKKNKINGKSVSKRTESTSVESDTSKMGNRRKLDTNQKKVTSTMITSPSCPSKIANKKDPTKKKYFTLLDDKKKSLKHDSSKLDVYEFTFDPNEEPPPKKRKKKKYTKNPSKPEKVVKSSYEKNLEKALAALKKTVTSKNKIELPSQHVKNQNQSILKSKKSVPATNVIIPNITENKYNSIRVEDIAMQFQESYDGDDNIDYSPVNSPHHALPSPVHPNTTMQNPAEPILSSSIHSKVNSKITEIPISNKDPLNLQDNLSFFDEQPVASSSMNVSVRHPLASPWRVVFNNLPIKWQNNSHVKSNITPAIEGSYNNYNDKQNKHVYTNIVTDANEPLPQIVDNPQPHTSNLKQTSIISFIKEVVEKKANKKKKHNIIKNNTLFDDIILTQCEFIPYKKKNSNPEIIVERSNTPGEDIQSANENEQKDNSENSAEVQDADKVSEKMGDEDITYFGFDESENHENVSPVKKKIRKETARTQSHRVLRELNDEVSSRKNTLPLAAMSRPTRLQIAKQLKKPFDDTKIANETPAFTEQNNNMNTEINNVDIDLIESNIDNDDSHSVRLFEDIELVHYLKPTRKSYGKSKKVTLDHNTDVRNHYIVNQGCSDEDDLDNLSFKLPTEKEKKIAKKKSKKNLKSKKEEKELEEWATGFNSLCEDIEEFDLVVE